MAYDRYDTRRDRDWRGGDNDRDFRGRRDERGFFERAGDEIASWFGDDEAERRRREDERMNRGSGREYGNWSRDRDFDRDRFTAGGWARESDFDRDRPAFRGQSRDWDRGRDFRSGQRSQRDYERMGYGGYDRDLSYRGGFAGTSTPDYMSPTGPSFGYGGTYGAGTSGGYGSGGYGSSYGGDRESDRDFRRSQSPWGRDDYRTTSYAGSTMSGRDSDRHYHSWRQRQLDELDRDYDRYNRERQERFENDFGTWRQDRMSKRGRLSQIREHMDVVGSDGETVGKVDCVKGDHVVLTKSDSPDNRHHAIDCSMIEAVEGEQVRLAMPAEEAKSRWEDAGDSAFFGRDRDRDRLRDDEEETNLNRSFSGTYES